MIKAAADFHADIVYVERRRLEEYESEILGALLPVEPKYLDTVYGYDIARDENRKMWAPGLVRDVLKKGDTWYVATNENMLLYRDGAADPESITPLPTSCDANESRDDFYSSSSCEFAFRGGKLIMRHTRTDTNVKKYKKDGLTHADETHKITRTLYDWNGKEFANAGAEFIMDFVFGKRVDYLVGDALLPPAAEQFDHA
jgi:hypothetical protein